MKTTPQNDAHDAQHLNQKLRDALVKLRESDGRHRDDQLQQGRFLGGFEIDFKKEHPNADAYLALARKSEEVPGLIQYTDRHLRNLKSFASLFVAIKNEFATRAAAAGSTAEPEPPAVSMTHYLTVDVEGLSIEQKIELLFYAEKDGWSVKHLKRRVNAALGIESETGQTRFEKLLVNAKHSITELTKLINGNSDLNSKQLTTLWDLASKNADYSKALCEVAPKDMTSVIEFRLRQDPELQQKPA